MIVADAKTVRLSTGGWPKGKRSAPRYEAYSAFLGCDIEPVDDAGDEFEASARKLPGLDILSVTSSALRVRRSPTQLETDHLFLNINLAGSRTMYLRNREAMFGEGEALLMSGEVGGASVPHGARFITLKMSVKAIAPLVRDLGDRLLRPIPRETEALHLLTGYLGTLGETGMTARPDLQRIVATHVHDLTALALGAVGEAADEAKDRGARAARLKAAKADIAANIDGDVSIASVARRHRVTPRSIQMAFEADGTTFSDFVLAQRLARARKMLLDPRLGAQKISALAYDAGFGDLSYFNRVFRRHFGVTPSEFRALADAACGSC
jgi:AraC-like DNA-binding protein